MPTRREVSDYETGCLCDAVRLRIRASRCYCRYRSEGRGGDVVRTAIR